MQRTSLTRAPRRGLTVAAAGLALAAGVAVVATTPADADSKDPAPSGQGSELRKDLREARDLDGTARRDALADIRDKARDGGYGDQVEHRFDRRGDRRAAFMALLPDELQADLEKARDAEGDDRKDQLEAIREKALDGGYGEKVKEAAEILKDSGGPGMGFGPFGR